MLVRAYTVPRSKLTKKKEKSWILNLVMNKFEQTKQLSEDKHYYNSNTSPMSNKTLFFFFYKKIRFKKINPNPANI